MAPQTVFKWERGVSLLNISVLPLLANALRCDIDSFLRYTVEQKRNTDYEELVLGNEIFPPDSSRFWALADYQVGVSPKSYDKQFVRDWLIGYKLNGVTSAPELPEAILNATANIYKECYCRITRKEEY